METLAGSEIEEQMDRISELPECILHRIISRFGGWDPFCTKNVPPAEVVRMSVLSKTWFNLTASFPILYFNFHNFKHVARQSFFKYVEYATSRFCRQKDVTKHTFILITNLLEPAELDIVSRCLELLLNKGGSWELWICFDCASGIPKYRLPNILLSVSTLKCLTIRDCDLPSSFMVDAVKFKCLIVLKLQHLQIDDEGIEYLATCCPLLQVFSLRRCIGFKRFCVHGHQHLRNVRMFGTPVEKIDIEAPNLCRLVISDCDERGVPQMNLASCIKLTKVTYIGNPLLNLSGFTNFLSNFSFIETLVLKTKSKCKNLKLSSSSLRTLVLRSPCDLEEIEFRTPNLVEFSYPFNHTLLWPPVSHSNSKAWMQIYPEDFIDTHWFQNLRQFLDKKNGFKVFNLYIHARYNQKLIELEKLKAIGLPPYELEHVELQLETQEESSNHEIIVDAALWCCRPQSLILKSSFPLTDFEKQSNLVKFTYKKLLQQEGEGRANIQIVSPSSSKAQKHLRGLMREGKAISFIKEEEKKADSKMYEDMEICCQKYADMEIC